MNFVVDNGKVIAATPAFFGANPATVKDGPRKGLRTLPESENFAIELFNSLAGVAISETGVRRPTTAAPIACSWSDGSATLIERLGIRR